MKSTSGLRTGQPRWSWSDAIALTVVTAAAGAIRGIHLSRPPFIYSDEMFYAREACIYVYASQEICGIPLEAISAHPPLGKWLISLGIRVFGWEPLGWRSASLVAGTLTVALLYLLARRLLGSTWGATFAAGLLAIDFLHFVQSRIAMLDVFLTLFVVASFLCVVMDRDSRARGAPVAGDGQSGMRAGPWLVAAGLAAGAGIATKWVGLPVLLGVAALACVPVPPGPTAQRWFATVHAALRREWLAMVLALAIAPSVVYVASHVARVEGSVLALPWVEGSWIRTFSRVQREMLSFHRHSSEIAYLGKTNAYVSPAWAWPLIKRPMIYYSREQAGNAQVRIAAMGSPLVWWTALAALSCLAVQMVWRRDEAAIVAMTGFVVLYGPLVLVSSVRPATFVYYILPAVPFMCLALAAAAASWTRSVFRWTTLAFSAAALALFVFFYPVLAGALLSEEEVQARQWFQDCRPATGMAAPAGWCWQVTEPPGGMK